MPTDDEHIPPEYRRVGGKKPATPRTVPLSLPNAVHDQTTKVFRGATRGGDNVDEEADDECTHERFH